MRVFRRMIDEWSGRFDSFRYPRDFYLQMLCAVQTASNQDQLHDCVVRRLQWKDGKIREEPTGSLKVNGRFYSARQTKPNTYAPDTHDGKLRNRNFYNWCKSVMILQGFSTEHLTIIKERFELWPRQSLVIPAFLLHVLNPRVFPIFDQHVERAHRFFVGLAYNSGSTDISLEDYVAYHDFWVELISDMGTDLARAEYTQIKHVDDALWSIGKHLKPHSPSGEETVQRPSGHPARASMGGESGCSVDKGGGVPDASSPEFINRVFSYCRNHTQSESMRRAAEELGVKLPDSYLKYPASHIGRWRKQGYPR